ncbi:MAG: AAA family ATPase [Nitrososphaeria archaeon]
MFAIWNHSILSFAVGPLQVRKITALILLIYEKLLPQSAAKTIFYFSCEELTDLRILGEILDNYLSFSGASGIRSSYMILDEITFVEDRFRAIKARIDRGMFENDVNNS